MEVICDLTTGIRNIEPKSIEDLLNNRRITTYEKDLLDRLYQHICDLGYKEFIDANPKLLKGFTFGAKFKNGKLTSGYELLSKEDYAVIKYIQDQVNEGKISRDTANAFMHRSKDTIPYEIFKYMDTPENEIPEHITCSDFGNVVSKAEIIEYTEIYRNIREFLSTQSIPENITVSRADNFSVIQNIKIGDKSLVEMMKNPADKEEVLRLLNDKNNPQSIKFDNVIGTSLGEPLFEGDIIFEIDVPKGTKGTYIDPIIPIEKEIQYDEREFLLQMGTRLEIQSAEFKDGKWYLKAIAKQDNINSDGINRNSTNADNKTEQDIVNENKSNSDTKHLLNEVLNSENNNWANIVGMNYKELRAHIKAFAKEFNLTIESQILDYWEHEEFIFKDSDGNIIRKLLLDMEHSDTWYEYDTNGNKISETKFDKKGNKIKSETQEDKVDDKPIDNTNEENSPVVAQETDNIQGKNLNVFSVGLQRLIKVTNDYLKHGNNYIDIVKLCKNHDGKVSEDVLQYMCEYAEVLRGYGISSFEIKLFVNKMANYLLI